MVWLRKNWWLILATVVVLILCIFLIVKMTTNSGTSHAHSSKTTRHVKRNVKKLKTSTSEKQNTTKKAEIKGSISDLNDAQVKALIIYGASKEATGSAATTYQTIVTPGAGVSSSDPITIEPETGMDSVLTSPGDGTFNAIKMTSVSFTTLVGYTLSGDNVAYYANAGKPVSLTPQTFSPLYSASLTSLYQKYYQSGTDKANIDQLAARISVSPSKNIDMQPTSGSSDDNNDSSNDSDNGDSSNSDDDQNTTGDTHGGDVVDPDTID